MSPLYHYQHYITMRLRLYQGDGASLTSHVKEIGMKYFIPQIDQTDCGFACLKMLIAHLYEDERALFIKQDENHGPYNMSQIKEKGVGLPVTKAVRTLTGSPR